MTFRALIYIVNVACWSLIFLYVFHKLSPSNIEADDSLNNSMKSSWAIPGNNTISDNVRFISLGIDFTVWTQMITLMLKCLSFLSNRDKSVSFERNNGCDAKSSSIYKHLCG